MKLHSPSITPKGMASKLSLSNDMTPYRWLTGKNIPSYGMMELIAKEYDLPLDELTTIVSLRTMAPEYGDITFNMIMDKYADR